MEDQLLITWVCDRLFPIFIQQVWSLDSALKAIINDPLHTYERFKCARMSTDLKSERCFSETFLKFIEHLEKTPVIVLYRNCKIYFRAIWR